MTDHSSRAARENYTKHRTEDVMSQVGIGVMIGILGGNAETVETIKGALGKTISEASIRNDDLMMRFDDGTGIRIYDGGQCCCENRYMRTDDDLEYIVGSTLLNIELRDVQERSHEWGCHEVQFLVVTTSNYTVTVANHNEHNGYYGGFGIKAEPAP